MKISIKLYGDFKKYAVDGKTQFELTVDTGSTFQDILTILSISEKGYMSLVNGRRIDREFCFSERDVLVLFPEITGG